MIDFYYIIPAIQNQQREKYIEIWIEVGQLQMRFDKFRFFMMMIFANF